MKPGPLFYIQNEEQEVAGPYDLVQMAGLLRKKIITGETPTRLEGSEDWKPFSWQPQFIVAREMPADAVSNRQMALDDEARASKSPVPLPSAGTVLKLAGLVGCALLAGAVSWLLAYLDKPTGYCLLFAGGGAALVAQILIILRVLDEGFWTVCLVFFVPMGDIYYFISNIWRYFFLFCGKYIGLAVYLGALAGLSTHK